MWHHLLPYKRPFSVDRGLLLQGREISPEKILPGTGPSNALTAQSPSDLIPWKDLLLVSTNDTSVLQLVA